MAPSLENTRDFAPWFFQISWGAPTGMKTVTLGLPFLIEFIGKSFNLTLWLKKKLQFQGVVVFSKKNLVAAILAGR